MMIPRTALVALIALAAALGLSTPAGAVTAAVDQYTEQIPSAGGPVPNSPKPTPTPKPKAPQANTSNSPSVPASPVTETAPAAPAESDSGTVAEPKRERSHPRDRKAEKAPAADQGDEADETLMASTGLNSGDPGAGIDGGGSAGWLFPVMLVLVAAIIMGVAVNRSRGRRVQGS